MKARATAAAIAAVLFCANRLPAAAESIAAAGSTALLPLVKAEAQKFARSRRDVRISVSGGGSGTGLTEVAIGAIDIGNSDIPARGVTGVLDHRVAVVGFAIIANPAIRVSSLTRVQLRDIFSGQLTNWRQAGGPDVPIVVVNRPRSSGTRKVFSHTVMQAAPIADSSLTVEASGTVVETVRSTPGAISYVALSAIRRSDVRRLAIDGVAPVRANILSGRYPLWAYEHMYTTAHPRPEIEAFIHAIASDTVLLRQLGYFRVADMRVRRDDR